VGEEVVNVEERGVSAMDRRLAVVLLSLSASLACAPDDHGDLRTQVVVRLEDGKATITYRGVGVGMDVPSAFAALGERDVPVTGGAALSWQRTADFGTSLSVMYASGMEPVIVELTLVYEGNPVAIGKVRERWLEALGIREEDCRDGDCVWDDGEVIVASVTRERRWTGTDELMVTLHR
jgi:hypothetical protein